MPDHSSQPAILSRETLEMLACPVCFGQLELSAQALLIACSACQRKYPFLEGIPVLIPGRALIE